QNSKIMLLIINELCCIKHRNSLKISVLGQPA
ncbi:MAG: hypothetical protein ACI85O_003456, partial [Saprospiraceae bacterium]